MALGRNAIALYFIVAHGVHFLDHALEDPTRRLWEAPMTADERSRLVLSFAKVLYVNGQATEQTVSAAERLARSLGLRATIVPRWGGLELLVDDQQGMRTVQLATDPVGVEMDRRR